MRRSGMVRGYWLVLLGALLLGACAPAGGPARPEGGQAPPAERRVKSLTIVDDSEPLIVVTGMGFRINKPLRNAVHHHLAVFDHRGEVVPQLAVELPSLAKGTWVVRPDGTMQTTYRIHRDVTWHDGAPLTARDFVFGWTVCMDPELPIEVTVQATAETASVARQTSLLESHFVFMDWKLRRCD